MPRLEALPVLVIAQRVTGDHGCYITAHLRVLNRLKRSRIQIHPALHVGDRQIRTILPQLLGAHLDASLQALIAIALRIHTHIRKRLAQLRRQRHLRHLQTLFARAQKPSDIFDAHRGEPLGILVAFDFSLVLSLPPLAFMVPVELHHIPARAVALPEVAARLTEEDEQLGLSELDYIPLMRLAAATETSRATPRASGWASSAAAR